MSTWGGIKRHRIPELPILNIKSKGPNHRQIVKGLMLSKEQIASRGGEAKKKGGKQVLGKEGHL